MVDEKLENSTHADAKPGKQIHWLKFLITIIGLLVISFGLAYILQKLVVRFDLPLYRFAWLAYLIVFGVSLAANMTIIAPVPFAMSIMLAAATEWNPILVALSASIGATIGELSGYYAGYMGRKIAAIHNATGYITIEHWIQRYGVWAIFFLAIQPVLPFDVGGVIAGTARMPLQKFLPALWGGRFPKYIIFVYTGLGLIHVLPFWPL